MAAYLSREARLWVHPSLCLRQRTEPQQHALQKHSDPAQRPGRPAVFFRSLQGDRWPSGCGGGLPGIGDVSVVDGQGGLEACQLSLQAANQLQRGPLLTLRHHGATSPQSQIRQYDGFSEARADRSQAVHGLPI